MQPVVAGASHAMSVEVNFFRPAAVAPFLGRLLFPYNTLRWDMSKLVVIGHMYYATATSGGGVSCCNREGGGALQDEPIITKKKELQTQGSLRRIVEYCVVK
ncbi:hypothetical protein IV203_012993 [Nitzschia inconspicua]|uniref:Uncharacterized protein n=1 Tax=Nitzschia inconspicua TaxID=303405 RepID=A0A9K3M475_9STRA|nr:hypothetical protein IV203_012993 [Nitzschia inconspicua]